MAKIEMIDTARTTKIETAWTLSEFKKPKQDEKVLVALSGPYDTVTTAMLSGDHSVSVDSVDGGEDLDSDYYCQCDDCDGSDNYIRENVWLEWSEEPEGYFLLGDDSECTHWMPLPYHPRVRQLMAEQAEEEERRAMLENRTIQTVPSCQRRS